jgi:signal peptidase II
MNLYDSIPVIQNIFHITYIHNTGIVFGMLSGHNFYILAGTVLFVLIFLFSLRKDFAKIYLENKNSFIFRTTLAMFVGGAIGNILDRFFRGYVVDFLDFRIWPIFNLADSFICVSFFVFVIYFFKKEKNK